jgi:MFS transporter, ACS family, hexuronate transporter
MIGDDSPKQRLIPHLRWWIATLLFASTVINYIDRQTFSVLAPYLQQDYHWTNTDYANLVIAFRVAYTIGQTLFGRLMDRIGTRRGLTLSVLWYSLVSVFTPLARGFYSFASFRFLLGAGESANWPGATKAVSEWFPKAERGLATALFDSGSSVGGAIAPLLVWTVYFRWGWRPVFVVPGLLGFVWLIVWRFAYHRPQEHPRIGDAERKMILADVYAPGVETSRPKPGWAGLLTLPQTWGTIVAKGLTDPVWFFVTDWFPIYLLEKGIPSKGRLLGVWVPFIASDLGNFFGGAASGYLIKRGWSLGAARKALVVFGGVGVLLLIPTVFTFNLWAIVALFSLATFSYAAFSTIANVLPSDLFFSESVASVSGMSGTGAGIGTIIATELIGHFSDMRRARATRSFDPIVIVAGMVPFVAMILVLVLVRNTRATEEGRVRRI